MRTVDEETRRLVMQNRIDALEDDKLFFNYKENYDEDIEVDSQGKKDEGIADFVPNEENLSSSSDDS